MSGQEVPTLARPLRREPILPDGYLKLARSVAARVKAVNWDRPEIEFDDLRAVALLAIWHASLTYDRERVPRATGRAPKLSTWCYSKARYACLDYCRTFAYRNGRTETGSHVYHPMRTRSLDAPLPTAQENADGEGLTLGELIGDEDFACGLSEDLASEGVWLLVDNLPHLFRHIVIQTVVKGRTLSDVGREVGLSEGRVSQIRREASGTLKRLAEHHRPDLLKLVG